MSITVEEFECKFVRHPDDVRERQIYWDIDGHGTVQASGRQAAVVLKLHLSGEALAVSDTPEVLRALAKSLDVLADNAAAARYPLWCVDRQTRVDPEHQYLGPYRSHDDALEYAEDSDLVRRCRQLRPSEIAFDTSVEELAEYELFDALIDELDEAATSGNLPEAAWYRVGERAVFEKYDDGTRPTSRDWSTWVDDHASLEAWICEGDE